MLVERNDAKVGLFVMLSLAVALGLVALVNARKVVERRWPLKVRLVALEGVTMGTEVQLQGYRVGRVEAVDLQSHGVEYSFLATLSLRDDIRLWEGTKALVVAKGFGGSALELQLPAPEARLAALQPGAEIPGLAGPSFGALVAQAGDLLRNLNGLTTDLRAKGGAYFTDTPQVRQLVQQVQGTLAVYEDLGRQVRGLAAQGGQSLEGLDRTLASAKQSADQVQALLNRRGPDLDKALETLPVALKQVDALSGAIQDTLKTTQPKLEDTLAELRRTLRSTQELLEQLKQKPNRILWGTPSEAEREKARKAVEGRKEPAPQAP